MNSKQRAIITDTLLFLEQTKQYLGQYGLVYCREVQKSLKTLLDTDTESERLQLELDKVTQRLEKIEQTMQ